MGDRIVASAAVLDLRWLTAQQVARTSEDELHELSKVLYSHFAAVRIASAPVETDRVSGADAGFGREALKALHWGLTAVHPTTLQPGLAGAIARTPSPGLAWYALVMWLFVVVAPSTPVRLFGGVCAATGAKWCAESARAPIGELADLDPPLVAAAALATLFSYVMVTILGRLAHFEATEATIDRDVRFRRFVWSATIAVWMVALLPRTVLSTYALSLTGLGIGVGIGVLESALNAADFRTSILVSALAISAAVLSAVSTVNRRRPLRLYEARTRAQRHLGLERE